jgi:SAM-dependent methyltransferase
MTMRNAGIDYAGINAAEWDRRAREKNVWTLPISRGEFLRAREGEWRVLLTPARPVPKEWFPPLAGLAILGLACGGGQQCPIFTALGADVTVFDLSAKQLETELIMAQRENYEIRMARGDMGKPWPFADASFDLVFNPVSNCYVRDVEHLWAEAYRVLRPGGSLLAGFANPCVYLFGEKDPLTVANRLPYDPLDGDEEQVAANLARGGGIEFSHSLAAQIGGQLRNGFTLLDLYEDTDRESPLAAYMPCYIATRSKKGVS